MNNFVNSNDFSYLNFPVSKILHDITNRVSNISTCVINFGNLVAEIIIFTSIILFIIFSSTDKNFYIFLLLLLIFAAFFLFFKNKAVKWSNLRGKGGNFKKQKLTRFFRGY